MTTKELAAFRKRLAEAEAVLPTLRPGTSAHILTTRVIAACRKQLGAA